MWTWHGEGMHGGWWGIGMLALWALAIVATIYVVRALTSRAPREASGPPSETPLEILKRRYARGEIDRAEFEEKRRDLT